MAIDSLTPRSRRALLFGALGGALASVGLLAKPRAAAAADPNDVVLDDVNIGFGTTEIQGTDSPVFQVLGADVAIRAAGDIAIHADATSVAVSGSSTDDSGVGVVGWSRAFSAGVIGYSSDGDVASPTPSARTGVQGVSDADDVAAIGVAGHATTGVGVNGVSSNGIGVRGDTTLGIAVAGMGPSGIDPWSGANAGVFGSAAGVPGVLGYSTFGPGVRGDGTGGDGVYGRVDDQASEDTHPSHTGGAGVHGSGGKTGVAGVIGSHGTANMTSIPDPIDPYTGVYGISNTGHGIYGASDSGIGVYAANNSATKGAIVAEGGPGTAIHGHANAGPVPASPALTGLYGSATETGIAIASDSANGLAVRATSSGSHAIRGRGALDGLIGESSGARSGVVGFSGAGAAPAGPAKTGVYGEATQDAAARGVHGRTTVGQGVRGEATTGIGVQAVSATGDALNVSGIVRLSRSGRTMLPPNRDSIDVTVPGGVATTALGFASLQLKRAGVHIEAVRPGFPSSSVMRIYLNKVASTTASTPLVWFVLG